MFSAEFGANPREYYEEAIRRGFITVNGDKVSTDYEIKNGDYIVYEAHRHEPPVVFVPAEKMIVYQDTDVIVVDKPASIACHPSGAYRYNSLTYILAKECGLGKLFPA